MHIARGLVGSTALSAGSDLFEIIIGLDDLPQLVFRGTVTAVRVGMVTFHQFLESRLDLRPRRRLLQSESVQGLALSIEDGSPPFRLGASPVRARCAELTQDIERIRRSPAFIKKPANSSFRTFLTAHRSHTPSRQVSREGVLLISRHRVIAHAGEVIIGLVVFADMGETEFPVFVFPIAPFRRAVACLLSTVRPVAARPFGLQPAVLGRLDPDAII
jgi:hypothetical protein